MRTYTTQELTEFAHEYLSGSNLVPIGVLDNSEFKAICRKLWGPEPTQKELEAEASRVLKQLNKLEAIRDSLVGPRGGKPRSGQALANYKQLSWMIDSYRSQIRA
jgi:hypothetical protein